MLERSHQNNAVPSAGILASTNNSQNSSPQKLADIDQRPTQDEKKAVKDFQKNSQTESKDKNIDKSPEELIFLEKKIKALNQEKSEDQVALKKSIFWWFKLMLLLGLFLVSSYYFGLVLSWIGASASFAFESPKMLFRLLFYYMGAVFGLGLMAGVIAGIIRPIWLAVLMFILSGVVLIWSWGPTVLYASFGLIYILMGILYVYGVQKEYKNRIKFSTSPVSQNLKSLSILMVALACVSLYFGYSSYVEEKSADLFQKVITKAVAPIRDQVVFGLESQLSAQFQGGIDQSFDQELSKGLSVFFDNDNNQKYLKYFAIFLVITIFGPLFIITRLLMFGVAILIGPLLYILRKFRLYSLEYKSVQQELVIF